jgi:hypothetical protein
MMDSRHARNMIDVQSYRGAFYDSDYAMVKLKYRPRISIVNKTTGQGKLKCSIDKLQNTTTAWEYKVTVCEELDEVCMDGDRNVNSWWKKIKEHTQTSAEKVLGFEEQKKQPP